MVDHILVTVMLLLAAVLAPLDPETAALALGASDGLCDELGQRLQRFESERRVVLRNHLLASLGDASLARSRGGARPRARDDRRGPRPCSAPSLRERASRAELRPCLQTLRRSPGTAPRP